MTQSAPVVMSSAVSARRPEPEKNSRADASFLLVAVAPISFILTVLLIAFFLRV